MSDSHGKKAALDEIIRRTRSNAAMYIHLGDGEEELEAVRWEHPELNIRSVAGNCDYCASSPASDIIEVCGVRIFACHGHRYGVNSSTELLRSIARDNGCAAALFGHTHCRYSSYEDGIYLLNPGSCSRPRDGFKPSFGTIDITSKGIVTNIVDL